MFMLLVESFIHVIIDSGDYAFSEYRRDGSMADCSAHHQSLDRNRSMLYASEGRIKFVVSAESVSVAQEVTGQ